MSNRGSPGGPRLETSASPRTARGTCGTRCRFRASFGTATGFLRSVVATFAVLATLGLAPTTTDAAVCLTLVSSPDGLPLGSVSLRGDSPTFTLTYTHSVTLTPVEETYGASGDRLIETSIRFEQHGPGLPTEAGAGETWAQRDGAFVVTMARSFDEIPMRVHRDQSPALVADGQPLDLAQWGNRAIVLRPRRCAAG